MRIAVDIDGTVCSNTNGDYPSACVTSAERAIITLVNKAYEHGHTITMWTSRGSQTGIDWRELTEKQLSLWHVKYNNLIFGKPEYDIYIGDKCKNVADVLADGKLNKLPRV